MRANQKFAKVILSRVSAGLDKAYDYSIPLELKEKIGVGSWVKVPFGSRELEGFVIDLADESQFAKIKPISAVLSDVFYFSKREVDLANWIAEYYFSSFFKALDLFLPPALVKKNKIPAEKSDFLLAAQPAFTLTSSQEKAIGKIKAALQDKKSQVFLLWGVAGSGKTEVYLRLVEEVLKQGKSVIVLVPEIILTSPIAEKFQARFGNLLAILHSNMKDTERRTEWLRLKQGEARIALGTRLALFAPISNLGIIIMDEESDGSYKQDQSPRYHGRTVAEYMAQREKIPLVLGSATPSVETFYRAKKNEIQLLALPEKVQDTPLPKIEVVDMHEEIKKGNRTIFSRQLRKAMYQALEKKKRIILFTSRRGHYTFILCRTCGKPLKCPHCEALLTFHSLRKTLNCPRCSFKKSQALMCPNCQGTDIRYLGLGTQRIEDELKILFPKAKSVRFDRESFEVRDAREKLYQSFASGQADILIGTQMVAKGFDFEKIALVGILSADFALNSPDFRSSEHTFQILTQAVGRSGRHKDAGTVILQTFNPEHFVIKSLLEHNYEVFWQEEIKQRQMLNFPPFSHMVRVVFSGENEEKLEKNSSDFARLLGQGEKICILGPSPAPIHRLKNLFRWQVVITSQDLPLLHSIIAATMQKMVKLNGIRIMIDVDPRSLL